VLLPIGKRKEYPELVLTVIYAHERDQSQRRDKIDSRLLTDLPVRSCLRAACGNVCPRGRSDYGK
jgi:hypothetical protein